MVNIIFLKILKEMIKRTSKYELDKGSLIMNSSYNVIQKLGSGAFGNVFMIVKNTFASEDSFKNIPDQASIKI